MFLTRHLFLIACFFTVATACAEDGSCSQVWYFWFAIFFAFLIIFIGAIFIANKVCQTKDKVKDFRIPVHSGTSRQKSGGQSSIQSRSTIVTILSPRLPTPSAQGTPSNQAVVGIGSTNKFGPRLRGDEAPMAPRSRLNQVSPLVVAEQQQNEQVPGKKIAKPSGTGVQSMEKVKEETPQKASEDSVKVAPPMSRVDEEQHSETEAAATAAAATAAATATTTAAAETSTTTAATVAAKMND